MKVFIKDFWQELKIYFDMRELCRVCDSETQFAFSGNVLQKYSIKYYKCISCGFLQTENPFWLKEAYESAITSLDIGLVYRNIYYSDVVAYLIKASLVHKRAYLDYGGGYGLFVRMMRDKGYNFYRQDIYCENLFAKNLDITDLNADSKFDLITAFEVFEHLNNPVQELAEMLKYADTIFFSTELLPSYNKIETIQDWWYISPETGQHIAFYTQESLKVLAEKFKLKYYSFNNRYHLFFRQNVRPGKLTFVRLLIKYGEFLNRFKFNNRATLLSNDYELAKSKLQKLI